MNDTVNYFGYGANASEDMMRGIVGRIPEGVPATLDDFELVIQQGDQIPNKVVEILKVNWSDEEVSSFRTYAIRHKKGAHVEGTLWKLTPEERALVDDWEINDGLWYDKTEVKVNAGGVAVDASTEIIDDPSLTPAVDLEPELPVFLNSKDRMMEVSQKLFGLATREE